MLFPCNVIGKKLLVATFAGALLGITNVGATEGAGAGHHAGHDHAAHAQHRADAPIKKRAAYSRQIANYTAPAVKLKGADGTDVVLSELLAEDRPVLMQFIFTSCATICPVLSATFANGQESLAKTHANYRMLSISIDPEYDTEERLTEYANRNSAGDNWSFLTGSRSNIGKVMRAFDVLYQGDNKMYHQPYTFIRARAGDPWVRIDGFLTASELSDEFKAALKSADLASR